MKLKVAFARNRWTEELIDRACEGERLNDLRQLILGRARIVPVEHFIDCDKFPNLTREGESDNWKVETHQKGGLLRWDPTKVRLWLSPSQVRSDGQRAIVDGDELYKELCDKRTLNANVLDDLVANQDLIPEGWKKFSRIVFWGTIYRCGEFLIVRCLRWKNDVWQETREYVSGKFLFDEYWPAVILED